MKNQLKKSMSLFLAVLMLLSCWVWVAPTEAGAVASRYYYKLVMNNTNSADLTGEDFRIYYKTNNGTGSETNTGNIFSNCGGDAGNNEGTYTWTGYCDGFPSKLYFKFGDFYWPTGKVRYENICLYIGKDQATANAETYKLVDNEQFEKSGDGAVMEISISAGQPVLSSATAKLEPSTVSLGKINTTATEKATLSLSGFYDQYEVEWASISSSFSISSGDNNLTNHVTSSGSGNSRTFAVSPSFQTLYPGQKSATISVNWSVNNGAKSGKEDITVDFPTYDATFDANGGKIGDDEQSIEDSIVINNDNMVLDGVIGKAPAYAAKTGFEFKGFYNEKNADATGKTASFSGTMFEDNVTKVPVPSKVNGAYPSADTTWYAAWQALPITATFLTADNQLIGTVEGRYNNYMTASNMYNGLSGLNAAVKASYTGSGIKFDANNAPVYKDGATTYNFDGWKIIEAYDPAVIDGDETTTLLGNVTFQATYKVASAEKYSVYFEDGNGFRYTVKDDNGTTVGDKYYSYRDDVIVPAVTPTKAQDDRYAYEFIGWAKDIGKNFYAVDEADRDENGATIAYTHKDGAEFTVKGDASYVPVFRMIPREYSVTYNYTGDNETEESVVVDGFHWHDAPTMPEIKDNYTYDGNRYFLTGWTVGNDTTVKQLSDIKVEAGLVLNAVYGEVEAAKYDIKFYGLNANGEKILLNEGNTTYEHNTPITVPEALEEIDTEDVLYIFKNTWTPSVPEKATGDGTYTADYEEKVYADVYFHNYDGELIYSIEGNKETGLFVGGIIPAYSNIVDGENVLPVKPEDAIGTYEFTGWADAIENGNPVEPGKDTISGDIHLYAQFNTDHKEYTVKFVDDDGTLISEEVYRYQDEIVIPANPTKAQDDSYIYDFRAWTPEVSKNCLDHATYTATYRRTPRYYKVTWFKDKNTAANKFDVLTVNNYAYEAKIQPAVMNSPEYLGSAGDGKVWAFQYWVECDENGNAKLDGEGNPVKFVNGQRMGNTALYFYPVFESVPRVHTVKFYNEDGSTLLGTKVAAYGSSIAELGEQFKELAPKLSDETNHYKINNWVTAPNGTAAATTLNADISVYASYTAEKHVALENKDIYNLIKAPTCTEPGIADFKCAADECTYIDYNITIAPISDEAKPAGQLYVGNNKWTLQNYKDGIDYSKVVYVGPTTNVIVNAEDFGTHAWDEILRDHVADTANGEVAAKRGVGKIDYFVHEVTEGNPTVASPATIPDSAWTEVYNYEAVKHDVLTSVLTEKGKTMQDYIGMNTPGNTEKKEIDKEVEAILATYNANATGVLSNLSLTNGKQYIIYMRVADREVNGESNKEYFSSGKLHYGSTAPSIVVTGEGAGTKFCEDATIKVTDDTEGFTVYLDGVEVTLDENGKYICSTAGLHTIEVTDKNGNKSRKIFEINGSHDYQRYTTPADCENAGKVYEICTICGNKVDKEDIPAIGHKFTKNFVEKAPTCTDNGYRTYVCDNNCGKTLVLKPTDSAAKLAEAGKIIKTEGQPDTVEPLTADDLKHLLATGKHTYKMVLDENGEETDEYVWVIDQQANCSVEGSKHRDCIVCGLEEARVTEVIAKTDDGHNFWRPLVEEGNEPDCVNPGKRTKKCKYCGKVEFVSEVPALGHTGDEYEITKAATCTEKGTKQLKCTRCGELYGDVVEIPALDHAWTPEGDPFEAEREVDGVMTTVFVQLYKCRVCDATKEEILKDYVKPVPATLTFKNGEEDAAPQVINTLVNASIIATDVTAPTKAGDATKTYSFSHWATKKADGTLEKVKFPIKVEGDATYYAVFSEKYVNYTITYNKEVNNVLEEYKVVGYLHNGDEVELADGPAMEETWQYKYEFAGWKVVGSDPEVVYTDKVTINAANINLVATYTPVLKKYAVTYAYTKNNTIESFFVKAGDAAKDCDIVPEKDYDSKYHYEFKQWNKAAQLGSVMNNIYTTPEYTPVLHTYTKDLANSTPATCGKNAVIKWVCDCGHSYEEVESGSALEHEWSDPVYDETTGKNTVTCTVCGATEEDTRTFTVDFYINEGDAQPIKTVFYIPWGTKLTAINLPATPVKEADSAAEYTFAGWALKGTTEVIADVTAIEVKKDTEYVAVFTAKARLYNVIFAYDGGHVIKAFEGIEAGGDVILNLAENETPAKDYDDTYHYVFKGWKGYKEGELNIKVENVQSNVYVLADFDKIKHSYDIVENLKNATCQNGKGTRYSCECGAYYEVTGNPEPHNYVEVERVEANQNRDGYIKYVCQNEIDGKLCGDEKLEVLEYVNNMINLKVTVLCNGAPKSGVAVEFIERTASGITVSAITNANGVAQTDTVAKDAGFDCYVKIDGNGIKVDLVDDGNGNLVGVYSYTTGQASCTCACHRDSIWGAVFRFFHKIIKLFTGSFKCCSNPDPMYG